MRKLRRAGEPFVAAVRAAGTKFAFVQTSSELKLSDTRIPLAGAEAERHLNTTGG
jgi:hypothetical protein